MRLAPLHRRFFARDPRLVAPELLGKILARRIPRSGKEIILAGRIVEVEVYLGAGDAAAHSAAGKTARNAVLFGAAGHAYVYFIYGNHFCLNVSCMKAGEAGSLLLRALEPLVGLEEMARNRGLSAALAAELDENAAHQASNRVLKSLTSGPGRLCQAFGITRERDNGKDFTAQASDLWIAAGEGPKPHVRVTPRIGITKAAEHPLRYIIAASPFVSGKKL